MRAETLYDGITQVADDLIEQAASPCVRVKKPRRWVPAVAAAAACAVLILTVPRFIGVGGSTDAAAPEAAEPGTAVPGAAPSAPPTMDAPAEPPIPAPSESTEGNDETDTPSAGGIYANAETDFGLEQKYWQAMNNCITIWYHETDFPQEVLEGVSVSVLSDAARPNVTLADGSESDWDSWDSVIDVVTNLDPAVEYWDFTFPNGVHSIMDSRNGQMVGYILP